MCMTSGNAELTGTVGYGAETFFEGSVVHILGYQNTVASFSGPNCMLLPIPSAQPMGPSNAMSAQSLTDALNLLKHYVTPRSLGGEVMRGFVAKGVSVFESGPYTVVLAPDAKSISPALSAVPSHKRPSVREELLASLDALYPGYHFALCCFEGQAAKTPEPLFWWYQPLNPDVVYIPGLDAHTGGPPQQGFVQRDHTLVFATEWGTHRPSMKIPGRYVERLEKEGLDWVFPKHFMGGVIKGPTDNGDFLYPISDLRKVAYTDNPFPKALTQWPKAG